MPVTVTEVFVHQPQLVEDNRGLVAIATGEPVEADIPLANVLSTGFTPGWPNTVQRIFIVARLWRQNGTGEWFATISFSNDEPANHGLAEGPTFKVDFGNETYDRLTHDRDVRDRLREAFMVSRP